MTIKKNFKNIKIYKKNIPSYNYLVQFKFPIDYPNIHSKITKLFKIGSVTNLDRLITKNNGQLLTIQNYGNKPRKYINPKPVIIDLFKINYKLNHRLVESIVHQVLKNLYNEVKINKWDKPKRRLTKSNEVYKYNKSIIIFFKKILNYIQNKYLKYNKYELTKSEINCIKISAIQYFNNKI